MAASAGDVDGRMGKREAKAELRRNRLASTLYRRPLGHGRQPGKRVRS